MASLADDEPIEVHATQHMACNGKAASLRWLLIANKGEVIARLH